MANEQDKPAAPPVPASEPEAVTRVALPDDADISAVEEASEKAQARGNPKVPEDERSVLPSGPD